MSLGHTYVTIKTTNHYNKYNSIYSNTGSSNNFELLRSIHGTRKQQLVTQNVVTVLHSSSYGSEKNRL